MTKTSLISIYWLWRLQAIGTPFTHTHKKRTCVATHEDINWSCRISCNAPSRAIFPHWDSTKHRKITFENEPWLTQPGPLLCRYSLPGPLYRANRPPTVNHTGSPGWMGPHYPWARLPLSAGTTHSACQIDPAYTTTRLTNYCYATRTLIQVCPNAARPTSILNATLSADV